jgi:phenylacetyl-CoA:acceptor oxidoreductase subunit 1
MCPIKHCGDLMPHWVMVIDLGKCSGCESCVAVCKESNQLPLGVSWRRVVNAQVQIGSANYRFFLPISCMQCANPPCVEVCPTAASHQHADGIVDIDRERCIGCGYCMLACPYDARTLVSPESAALSKWMTTSGHDHGPRHSCLEEGVCTKCNMCRPKIQTGLAQGLTPGLDSAATPSCANSCPWGAIYFGYRDDPDSRVSKILRQNAPLRIHAELGTEPSIYYINAHPVLQAETRS